MALLATEALDLGDRHTLDPNALKGLFDLIELERLHDGFDLFHADPPPASSRGERRGNVPRVGILPSDNRERNAHRAGPQLRAVN
jgi:hypothetical protein